MKVILKEPNQKQKIVEVDSLKLKTIYNLLKCSSIECFGYVKKLQENNIDIVLDEELKLTYKPQLNIVIENDEQKIVDILVGNVLFVGVDGEDWVGLNKEQIDIVNSLLNSNMSYMILDNKIINTSILYI